MAFVPVLNYPVEISQPNKLELAITIPRVIEED